MYPDAELDRLETHKAALRLRIAIRRLEISIAAAAAGRPVVWLDKVVAFWRRVSPLAKIAAIPAALLLQRTLHRRTGLLGTLLRWGPAIFSTGKAFSAMRQPAQSG